MSQSPVNPSDPHLPAPVRRRLRVAGQRSSRAAVGPRPNLGSRVIAAREPKLLRASTRIAAARTRVGPGRPAAAPLRPLLEGAPSFYAPAQALQRAEAAPPAPTAEAPASAANL